MPARPNPDADKLSTIEEAHEDMTEDAWFGNSVSDSMQLPAGFFNLSISTPGSSSVPVSESQLLEQQEEQERSEAVRRVLLARGIAPADPASAQPFSSGGSAAAAAAASSGDGQQQEGQQQQQLRRRTMMVHAVREWLRFYGGRSLLGGYSRPKVRSAAWCYCSSS